MSPEIILIIQIAVLVLSVLITKFIPVQTLESIDNGASMAYNAIVTIYKYAECFVSWARYFKNTKTGAEKMTAVVEQLKIVAKKHSIDVSEDELTAIAQKAYEKMISSEDNKKEVIITKSEDCVQESKDSETIVATTVIKNDEGEDVAMLNDDTKIIK